MIAPPCLQQRRAGGILSQPFIISFCQCFSRMLAAKHLQNHRFFTRAFELALVDGHWASICLCKMDAWAARRAAVCSQTPLVLTSCGASFTWLLRAVMAPPPRPVSSPTGKVITDPEEVQAKCPFIRPFFRVAMWPQLELMLWRILALLHPG